MFHVNEAGFQIQCGLQGCQRTFRNFHTFRNHIYSMHDVSIISTDRMDESSSDDDDDDLDTGGIISSILPDSEATTMKHVSSNTLTGRSRAITIYR